MALRDKIKDYDKKYGTGNFFKFKEGKNQIRILAEPEMYDDVMDDQPKGTFITYALVRDPNEGDQFVIISCPMVIIRWLADEQELGKFDSYPMPYDVVVSRKGSGLNSKYSVSSLTEAMSEDLTLEQQQQFKSLKPVKELAHILEDKKRASLPAANLPALPAEAVEAHNKKQAAVNKAEMNASFISVQKGIQNAETTERLDKALEFIEITASLDDFEKDMLRGEIESKRASLTSAGGTENMVEDIPF